LGERARVGEVFALSAPTSELVPEVRREFSLFLGLDIDNFPFETECRGPVCTVTPKDKDDPVMATWISWWRRFEKAGRDSVWFADIQAPMSPGTIFVRVRPEADRPKVAASSVARELIGRVDVAGVFERCKQGNFGTGPLLVQLGLEKGGRKLGIEAGGTAANTPLGTCIVNEVRDIAGAIDVPDTRTGVHWTISMMLPEARSLDQVRPPWR
jgi:hypothetical protein